jgi:hypothetical protein
LGFAKSRRGPPGGPDWALAHEFQLPTVQMAYVAADEHVVPQQRIDRSPVCLGMIFEHDGVEISGGTRQAFDA